MDTTIKTSLWQQFGAAIDMLDNSMRACPDELWQGQLWEHPGDPPGFSQFWYLAYHTLFWLDYYLSSGAEGFAPPAPFTLDEMDPAGVLPEQPYSREELLAYRDYGRRKCRAAIESLTDAQPGQPYKFRWGEASFVELQLYNMRHVQEHAAQLSMFLGQQAGFMPGWVGRAKGI